MTKKRRILAAMILTLVTAAAGGYVQSTPRNPSVTSAD